MIPLTVLKRSEREQLKASNAPKNKLQTAKIKPFFVQL